MLEFLLVKWLTSGFVATLSLKEVLALWDAVFESQNVDIFAMAAASIIAFKGDNLLGLSGVDAETYLQENLLELIS